MADTNPPLLLQFAGSHYCEKARWALDHKHCAYRVRNLVPGRHVHALRPYTSASHLPVLVAASGVLQGSGEIIDYLDKTIPQPALTPTHSTDRSVAYEWERYLDGNLGVPIRALFYYYGFQEPGFVRRFFLSDAPWWANGYLTAMWPLIRGRMRDRLDLNNENISRAEQLIAAAFDRLDERIEGKKFLAGPHFSRADLTAAALLFHCFEPGWPWPNRLMAWFEPFRSRPFYHWAHNIYATYRGS